MTVRELIQELLKHNMAADVKLVDGVKSTFDDCSHTDQPCLKLVVDHYGRDEEVVFTSIDEYY